MKAISMHQPHASLFAAGLRLYETRTWFPDHGVVGQQIAIQAARYVDKGNIRLAEKLLLTGDDTAAALVASMAGTPSGLWGQFGKVRMPVGCIVCLIDLDAAFELGDIAEGTLRTGSRVKRVIGGPNRSPPSCFSVPHDAFGDFSPGRWAWLLRNPKPVKPMKMAGRQRFFELPQGWLVS